MKQSYLISFSLLSSFLLAQPAICAELPTRNPDVIVGVGYQAGKDYPVLPGVTCEYRVLSNMFHQGVYFGLASWIGMSPKEVDGVTGVLLGKQWDFENLSIDTGYVSGYGRYYSNNPSSMNLFIGGIRAKNGIGFTAFLPLDRINPVTVGITGISVNF